MLVAEINLKERLIMQDNQKVGDGMGRRVEYAVQVEDLAFERENFIHCNRKKEKMCSDGDQLINSVVGRGHLHT